MNPTDDQIRSATIHMLILLRREFDRRLMRTGILAIAASQLILVTGTPVWLTSAGMALAIREFVPCCFHFLGMRRLRRVLSQVGGG